MSVGNPVTLPGQRAALVDSSGRTTREFYRFFQTIETLAGPSNTSLQAEITEIAYKLGSPDGSVANIPPQAVSDFLSENTGLFGQMSVHSQGTLADGLMILTLVNDAVNPGINKIYSTDSTGAKGWHDPAAIGSIYPQLKTDIQSSSNILIAADDGAQTLTPDLSATGVTAGVYGDDSHIPQITVDSNGRITNIILINTGVGTFAILCENGDYLTTESGNHILGTL